MAIMADGAESPFCNCLFFTANALGRTITRLAEESFAPTGLSPSHAFVVMAVNKTPGVTPTALAAAMQLERSTVTRLVDYLDTKGWVLRKADGRNIYLYPEKPAKAADASIRKAWQSLYKKYVHILGEEAARNLTAATYAAHAELNKIKKRRT